MDSYRAALEVRTRDAHPVQWAGTQNNLTNALADQGTNTGGAKFAALLALAMEGYHAALHVRTREVHPVHWAGRQGKMARAELARADLGGDGRGALTAALGHVTAALEVSDPVHMQDDYDKATAL